MEEVLPPLRSEKSLRLVNIDTETPVGVGEVGEVYDTQISINMESPVDKKYVAKRSSFYNPTKPYQQGSMTINTQQMTSLNKIDGVVKYLGYTIFENKRYLIMEKIENYVENPKFIDLLKFTQFVLKYLEVIKQIHINGLANIDMHLGLLHNVFAVPMKEDEYKPVLYDLDGLRQATPQLIQKDLMQFQLNIFDYLFDHNTDVIHRERFLKIVYPILSDLRRQLTHAELHNLLTDLVEPNLPVPFNLMLCHFVRRSPVQIYFSWELLDKINNYIYDKPTYFLVKLWKYPQNKSSSKLVKYDGVSIQYILFSYRAALKSPLDFWIYKM
jgi:hypothetical protein